MRRLAQAPAVVASIALGVSFSFAPLRARAADLAPSRAEADVRRARDEGINAFCTHPARPLSVRARELCPLAADLDGCQALVDACASDAAHTPAAKADDAGTPRFGALNGLFHLLGGLAQVLIWVLVAAVVVAIAIPIVQAIRRRRRDREVADAPADAAVVTAMGPTLSAEAPAVTDAELLLRRAEDLARRGELDRATLTFLGAALRALDQRGVIRIARHRTNGEYVRGCKDAEVRAALRDIVREVERAQFGGEPTSPEAVSHVARRAAALVRQTAGVVTALALLLACASSAGCAVPSGGFARAGDPAGDEMLFELLKRQGVSATRLGGSLATLPMPKAEGPSPVIVIDLERVALEDDARAHLARWAEAGGTLVLAGRPSQWPGSLEATSKPGASSVVTVLHADVEPGHLARPSALAWAGADAPLASLEGGETYAAIGTLGEGKVIGLANDDLLTNAGLARRGNAGALVALLTHADDFHEVKIARPEDGISPPSNPVAALNRAGLGLGLWHALAATLLAFLAVGTRMARAKPTAPPQRRAFTEHVEATGALYARARIAAHALAAYARFADERLRARMPRAMTDPARFLASRANADPATCAELWARATAARTGAPPRGDELATLRHLSQLVTEATRTD